jgi:hypothetical protein
MFGVCSSKPQAFPLLKSQFRGCRSVAAVDDKLERVRAIDVGITEFLNWQEAQAEREKEAIRMSRLPFWMGNAQALGRPTNMRHLPGSGWR